MRNETERMHFTQTRLSEYADGTFRIPECGVPQVYEVHVEIEGSSIENSYEIYAFPKCHSKLGDVVNILRQKADTLPVITDRYPGCLCNDRNLLYGFLVLPDVCIDLREHEQTKTGWNDGTLHPLRASGAGGVCDGGI